jgi:hypothetical protein
MAAFGAEQTLVQKLSILAVYPLQPKQWLT